MWDDKKIVVAKYGCSDGLVYNLYHIKRGGGGGGGVARKNETKGSNQMMLKPTKIF